jgi:hypothetical protein
MVRVKEDRPMNDRRVLVAIALGLALLAGGLRFYRLGNWPLHGDELATIDEARALFTPLAGAPTTQIERLPRLVPLGASLLYAGHELFGRDEFGLRVMGALFGTLHVVLVFLCLNGSLGRVPALATALLIAFWPEHLYRSQENRYYMLATAFASLGMLCGALALPRRSVAWTALGCLAIFAAILTHTLQGLLLGGLFVALLAAGGRAMLRPLLVVAGAGVIAGIYFVAYALPIIRGWNAGESWGYGISHSLFAAISQLGWPIALLAAVGFLGAWQQGTEQGRYWMSWAVIWLVTSAVLPLVVPYHPAYVFPLSLGVLVLAGQAVGMIYEGLRAQHALAAAAWVGLAALLNLPGLVSHYADGSRPDLRTAARFVARQWQDGDRVCTYSPRLLQHYLPDDIRANGISLSRPVADLQKNARTQDRFWVVIASGRGGKAPEVEAWLNQHCTLALRERPRRFDYYENVTEVYLFSPPGPAVARVSRAVQLHDDAAETEPGVHAGKP